MQQIYSIDQEYWDNHCTTTLEAETYDEDVHPSACNICIKPYGGVPVWQCWPCPPPDNELVLPSRIGFEFDQPFGGMVTPGNGLGLETYDRTHLPFGPWWELVDNTQYLELPPQMGVMTHPREVEAIREVKNLDFYGCWWGRASDYTLASRPSVTFNHQITGIPWDWTPPAGTDPCDIHSEIVDGVQSRLIEAHGRIITDAQGADFQRVEYNPPEHVKLWWTSQADYSAFSDFNNFSHPDGLVAEADYWGFRNELPNFFGGGSPLTDPSNGKLYYPSPAVVDGDLPPIGDPIWNTYTQPQLAYNNIVGMHGYEWRMTVDIVSRRLFLILSGGFAGHTDIDWTVYRQGIRRRWDFPFSGDYPFWEEAIAEKLGSISTCNVRPQHKKTMPQGTNFTYPCFSNECPDLDGPKPNTQEIGYSSGIAPWWSSGWATDDEYQQAMNPDMNYTTKGGHGNYQTNDIDFTFPINYWQANFLAQWSSVGQIDCGDNLKNEYPLQLDGTWNFKAGFRHVLPTVFPTTGHFKMNGILGGC